MNRSEILNILNSYKETHQVKYHFSRIGIFGSVAKNIASEISDIDIVVEMKEPDLFILGCIKTELEEQFGKKVDIVRFRTGMNSFLKKRIEQEAVYV